MPIPDLDTHKRWMRYAIDLAKCAEQAGEVPVGALIVKDNQILAEGWNRPIATHDPSAHAEMMALRAAGASLLNYRITDATLYVTLEPCVMCTGALMHARVDRVVYGASDPKAGAMGGCFDLLSDNRFNHTIEAIPGILEEECGNLLRRFFGQRRGK